MLNCLPAKNCEAVDYYLTEQTVIKISTPCCTQASKTLTMTKITVSCCSTMVGIQQQTDRDNKERCERIE